MVKNRIDLWKRKPSKEKAPPCFNSQAEFDEWKACASNLSTTGAGSGLNKKGETNYCVDCTPEYKGRMRFEKRCSHVKVTFHISTKDGGLSGRRPNKTDDRKKG